MLFLSYKMKNIIYIICTLILFSFFNSKISASSLDDIKNRGYLICGVSEDFVGFSTLTDNGEWVGFDVDLCRAVAVAVFGDTTKVLAKNKLNRFQSRLVVEKPLGYNISSAKKINSLLLEAFEERQIYRIDHYLGKETVQNLMALRFANTIFESQWDNNAIDNVQITVAETIGVKGIEQYYDTNGALRDMVQNHLLQCYESMH